MKYEIKADSFIDAVEQLMGQYLNEADGNVTSYDMSGDRFSMKIKIKQPKKSKAVKRDASEPGVVRET